MQRMIFVLHLVLLPMLQATTPSDKPKTLCARTYEKVGCYEAADSLKLAITDRDTTSKKTSGKFLRWGAAYEEDLHSLACRCNAKAMEAGADYFAIEYWAECWIGNITSAEFPSPSTRCKGVDFKTCKNEAKEECTGEGDVQYIFKVKKKTTPTKIVTNGCAMGERYCQCTTNATAPCTCEREYSGNGTHCRDEHGQWTKFSSCSKACGVGRQSRVRQCIYPKLSPKGERCDGANFEIKRCIDKLCPDSIGCANGSHECECSDKSCICKYGYSGDGQYCRDINECDQGYADCPKGTGCINTDGGYTCGTAECAASDSKCNCTVDAKSHLCTCQSGYIGNGFHCDDINECATFPCHGATLCKNTEGSYECAKADCAPGKRNCKCHDNGYCQCKSGYSGNGMYCSDLNECLLGKHQCPEGTVCHNTVGSFICGVVKCSKGSKYCQCVTNATHHKCHCERGYYGNGTSCKDVDECAEGNYKCPEGTTCHNTEGSYICGTVECTNGASNCQCTSNATSHHCSCESGYVADGGNCTDINECVNPNVCPYDKYCRNKKGTFLCGDLDCQPGRKWCTCTENSTYFKCSCDSGYSVDGGGTCTDVDECAEGNYKCPEGTTCHNTDGSYICGMNTCWEANSNCQCTTVNATRECNCKSGFSGNGTHCTVASKDYQKVGCYENIAGMRSVIAVGTYNENARNITDFMRIFDNCKYHAREEKYFAIHSGMCYVGNMFQMPPLPVKKSGCKSIENTTCIDGDESLCMGASSATYIYKTGPAPSPKVLGPVMSAEVNKVCPRDYKKIGCWTAPQYDMYILFSDDPSSNNYHVKHDIKFVLPVQDNWFNLFCRCREAAMSEDELFFAVSGKNCHAGDPFHARKDAKKGHGCMEINTNRVCDDRNQQECIGTTNATYIYATSANKNYQVPTWVKFVAQEH